MLRLNLILFTTVFGASQLVAEEEAQMSNRAQLGYRFDVRLVYVDSLSNPQTGSIHRQQVDASDTTEDHGRTRTLGLSRARLGVHWLLPARSRLDVVFRPDSDAYDRDYDGRAGDVYRDKPQLRLLDAYQLSVLFDRQFQFAAGVWESLVADFSAYESPLEFGLNVQMPLRFSAGRLRWQSFAFQPDRAQPNPSDGYEFALWVFSGRNDRAEGRSKGEGTYDTAPSAEDPHYGVALGASKVNGFTNLASLTLGMLRSNLSVVDDVSGQEHKLQKNELFWQIGDRWNWDRPRFATVFAADLRMSLEEFSEADELPNRFKPSARWQQSLALSTSTDLGWDNFILFGAHVGKSQLDEGLLATGYQVDLGYDQELSDGLWLKLLVADEYRELDDSSVDDTEGAFQNEDEKRSSNRRFAIEVRYDLYQG